MFNNAQIESIVTKLIVGAAIAQVSKYGVSSSELTALVSWGIAGIGVVGPILFSHWFYSAPPVTIQSKQQVQQEANEQH